jgi:demethylmenaquinone methyltransferase/2-methoxy-6-polyprenyl-1,4-benzoquinol methylase
MFARISNRYDHLNRVMTFGQDGRWRKETVQRGTNKNPNTLLDIGSGTGDLAYEALRQHPNATIIAVDFTPEMMLQGRGKPDAHQILWIVADGEHLPFANNAFDGALSGFLLRNLYSVDPALAEQFRVLAPGGRISTLDTTPPAPSIMRPLINLYLNFLIPFLGRILGGDSAAYSYLRDTTKQFLTSEQLVQKMRGAGYVEVRAVKRMLGIIAIYHGQKP